MTAVDLLVTSQIAKRWIAKYDVTENSAYVWLRDFKENVPPQLLHDISPMWSPEYVEVYEKTVIEPRRARRVRGYE